MQNLYSDQQAKLLDNLAQEQYGIPPLVLMEDAAFSTYNLIHDDIRSSKQVLFIAGGGNNGGDALAIARLAFLDGFKDIAILLADNGKETEQRKVQREACEKLGIRFIAYWDVAISEADLIVDGLFGIGLKGEPREPFDSLIAKINGSGKKVISLDVPSGMGNGVCFGKSIKATETVCMAIPKTEIYLPQNRDFAGNVKITFNFFPKEAIPKSDQILLDESDITVRPLARSAYKKTRGSVAIIGGSGRYTGAVVLATKAAFHAGAGLVTVFTEEKLISVIAKAVPSAMVSTYDKIADLSTFDAVLCGPGMGSEHDEALKLAFDSAKALVVDADGIRAFSRLGLKADRRCILTPHLGEYAALLSSFCPNAEADTPYCWIGTLKEAAKITGSTIVVKANTVWIASDGKPTYVIDGQNPSLGVAGSGDVLSGIITAFLAQGDDNAATDGALIHQKAGRLAKEKFGFYSSNDLINLIGKARSN